MSSLVMCLISRLAQQERQKVLAVEMGLAAAAEAVGGEEVMTHEDCPWVHFYVFTDYYWQSATCTVHDQTKAFIDIIFPSLNISLLSGSV